MSTLTLGFECKSGSKKRLDLRVVSRLVTGVASRFLCGSKSGIQFEFDVRFLIRCREQILNCSSW